MRPVGLLVLSLLAVAPVFAAGAEIPDTGAVSQRAESFIEAIKTPDETSTAAAREAGRQAGEMMLSPEYQKKVTSHIERLNGEVFTSDTSLKAYYPDGNFGRKSGEPKPTLASDERVFVFISFSIPHRTLRNYIETIDRGGDPNVILVMRGMIGGMTKLKPTLEFLAGLLIKDKACLAEAIRTGGQKECASFATEVLIDPLLFRRFGINQVPAVVYVRGVNAQDPEASEGSAENAKVGSYTVVYGDAALDGVLEEIADATASRSLPGLVKAMRSGGFY